MNQKLGSKLFPNFKTSHADQQDGTDRVLLREIRAFPSCVVRFLEGKRRKMEVECCASATVQTQMQLFLT